MRPACLTLTLFALLAAGCAVSQPRGGPNADGALQSGPVGATWRLVSFGEAAEGGARAALMAPPITANFVRENAEGMDGRLSGSGGCNRYRAEYESGADTLAISAAASTRRACRSPVMEQEQAYLAALEATRRWEQRDNRLTLMNEDGGALLHFTAETALGSARSSTEEDPASAMNAMKPRRTGVEAVYECTDADGKGFSLLARTEPGERAVWLPSRFAEEAGATRHEVLEPARAASGAKYQDGPVTVWTKGLDLALLEVDGQTFTGCTRRPDASPEAKARLRGADFRAVGQEPGWHLEIHDGERLRFVYAYGQKKAVTPAPAPSTDAQTGRTVYRAETHDLAVTITDAACTDAMSGEPFPKTVRVALGGTTYRGCGRPLR